MKKHFVLAVGVSTLMLLACGVQTADDGDSPASPGAAQFGGVDHGSDSHDAAAPAYDGGSAATDSGGGKTGKPDTAPADDAGGTGPTDAGSDAVDSGKPVTDSGTSTPDAGTVADAGSHDAADAGAPATDSGVSDAGADCGTDSGADAGTDSGADSGVDSGVAVPDNADVVRLSKDGKTFLISTRYIFSANCGEVLGPMPGVGWSSGPVSCDTNSDGYFTYTPIAGTVGTYAFTYRDSTKPADGWALYGNIDLLRAMSPTARSFVECNWWDSTTQKSVDVANPSCSLKATFGANGMLAGAGNMANLL